jgi:hypothetical protein
MAVKMGRSRTKLRRCNRNDASQSGKSGVQQDFSHSACKSNTRQPNSVCVGPVPSDQVSLAKLSPTQT